MTYKDELLEKLRRNTHEQYPMPDTPIDGISYDDTVKQFVDISMSVGSKVVMAKPGEKLDDIVRSAYPEAKTIASNIAELTIATINPDTVVEAQDLNGTDVGVVYGQIGEELASPEIISDIKKMTLLSKERTGLEKTVEVYKEYKKVLDDIEEAKELLKDKDMAEFAKEELANAEEKKSKLEGELEILLIPHDPNDDKNVIVEIRGAAGGDEANIFAGDLFDMYSKYASNEGWKIEILNAVEGTAGGYSQIEFMVKGDCVYSKLKYESGAHRVQRVPATESQGRVHTSTATVLVMPEAEEFDFELDESEVRIDITRSSGCGGQGVNTTDSAVRLTHIPTGIIVYSQTERSQIKNKELAFKILKTRLYDMKLREQEEKEAAERKVKIGTGDRSEKIRTYNYPQNRITDHRIGYTSMNLDRVMDGDMENLIMIGKKKKYGNIKN